MEYIGLKICAWLLGVMCVCLVVLLAMTHDAPDGYEDSSGFHYGKNGG